MLKHLFFIFTIFSLNLFAQETYWQQKVAYTMDFSLNVETNQYSGEQTITYTNNSPDVLKEIYLHAYFNAFQPNSLMDKRSRTIMDPDRRVGDRIYHLKPNEIGFTKVSNVIMDGKECSVEVRGTSVKLNVGEIQPGETKKISMDVHSQIPLQIRRSGRDNKDGIRYTMTQWYPKVAAYDVHGWHTDQYTGREFYGEWGSFDLCLTINKEYVVGGTGVLQNVGNLSDIYGYINLPDSPKQNQRYSNKAEMNTWHFIAENVHDFAFAADPDFVHKSVKVNDENQYLHFFYQEKDSLSNAGWDKLMVDMPKVFNKAKELFGNYPYSHYSFIQGGDGGMEYPMCTMVKGSSRGTAIHELMHSWYQGMLATNELWYEWMDEGFTTWASTELENYFGWQKTKKSITDHSGSVKSYLGIVKYKLEEPLCSHADMYESNWGYGASAYSKGTLFLENLSYIVGKKVVYSILKEYYNQWAFKHPTPENFIRIAEKESGINLDHFFINWTKTTKHIDYAISNVKWKDNKTAVVISKKAEMAIPLEVEVKLQNGNSYLYYMPLLQMNGEKKEFFSDHKIIQLSPISWVDKQIVLNLNFSANEIESINLFPVSNIPDIQKLNNTFSFKNLDVENTNEYSLILKKKKKKLTYRNQKGKKIKKKVDVDYIHYEKK